MNSKNMHIVYESKFDRIVELNESFDKGVLRVCYTGPNRNGSSISKTVLDRCMNTIYNCPIVCNYDRESNEIGSHDIDIVSDANGTLRMVNLTTPVGVIPESAHIWYETVEDNGVEHEYLCVNALLWKRQEAYQKIHDDGITAQSMEISVADGHMDNGVYVIDDFKFTALCLLGTAEPCFESASLEMFSRDVLKERVVEMMEDFKRCFAVNEGGDGCAAHVDLEGGEKALEEKMALMAEFGLTEEMLDFSLEEFELDVLREKFEAIVKQKKQEQFALAEQFCNELRAVLATTTVETAWGETSRYWYLDHDPEKSEVYFHDYEDWNLYGMTYSMNGDNIVLDYESKKRMKFAIVDFDEGEQTTGLAPVFEMISNKFAENDKEWSDKYAAIEATISDKDSEIETLKQYKLNKEQEELKATIENVFNQFKHLEGIEAFDALRSECVEDYAKYDVETLEDKCFAIQGRNALNFSVSSNNGGSTKLPVEKHEQNETEPYGGLFARYGITE